MDKHDLKHNILGYLANDKELRKKFRNNPHKFSSELGYKTNHNLAVVVVSNTKNKIYFVMPDETIDVAKFNVVAGTKLIDINVGTVFCVGSAGSASSMGCLCGSVGTVGTIGSAGTAGTIGV